jgi:hypothetical protein
MALMMNLFKRAISKTQPKPALPVPSVDGIKMNLGCGFDLRPGWMNIDLHGQHNPDLVCDATYLQPIEDNVASYVLAQDILEHIHRDRCISTLQEWNRVLKTGGLIEIRVPDVLAIARLMREPQSDTLEGHRKMLHCLFGTQGYEGDFHLNGFTERSLRDDLGQSGFQIERLIHKDEWLFEVIARKIEHCPPAAMLRSASDDEFLNLAYESIFGRPADDGGKAYFSKILASGTPREVVLSILRSSEEATAPDKTG